MQPFGKSGGLMDKIKEFKAKNPILIIEDDPAQIISFNSLFEKTDLDLAICQTGQEALSAFDQHQFDIAILDLGLPDIDGMELFEQLKQRNNHIESAVIEEREKELLIINKEHKQEIIQRKKAE